MHLALAMGGFAIGTTEFATMSLLPFMARDLHVSEPVASNVISAYALGVVVGAPVFAVLFARMARRSLLVLLMLLFGAANLLSAFASNYETMMLFRFLSGLPHGAYFGIAALVASSVVPPNKRTAAVGRVMLGLTVATVVGVPLANVLGQLAGWRWGFGIVALLAWTTVLLVFRFAPYEDARADASSRRELGALKQPQVWLTLATGAIGFGGVFAVYTYLASTIIEVTHQSAAAIPAVLMIFGIGMTCGNLVMPRFADRALKTTVTAMILMMGAMLALYAPAAKNIVTLSLDMFGLGFSVSLATMLQTRLMDVAGDAQALAAALNHSAFNTANALGPWLGGMAITAGFGWTSTGWVGVALAVGGLVIWGASCLHASPGRRLAEDARP
ncbi:MAG: MFS transporter [Azospirillaceae bacterium]|nr:MFS transporter [Azospirillaceae bacterium]